LAEFQTPTSDDWDLINTSVYLNDWWVNNNENWSDYGGFASAFLHQLLGVDNYGNHSTPCSFDFECDPTIAAAGQDIQWAFYVFKSMQKFC